MNEVKSPLKILGFTGPSGCGKDTAARYLAEIHPDKFNYVKLYTTRPQRDRNDDGYIFVSAGEFLQQIMNGDMLNAQEYNNWYYGLSKNSLKENCINVLPMSAEMVFQMKEEHRNDYDLYIIFIHTNDKQRLLHCLNRELEPDCHEICRRFLADDKEYYATNLLTECNENIINPYNQTFFDSVEEHSNHFLWF